MQDLVPVHIPADAKLPKPHAEVIVEDQRLEVVRLGRTLKIPLSSIPPKQGGCNVLKVRIVHCRPAPPVAVLPVIG
jgi:hypothetical protein